jgi:hypothetical protein
MICYSRLKIEKLHASANDEILKPGHVVTLIVHFSDALSWES